MTSHRSFVGVEKITPCFLVPYHRISKMFLVRTYQLRRNRLYSKQHNHAIVFDDTIILLKNLLQI